MSKQGIQSERGAALVGTLFVITLTSILLIGTVTLATSTQNRTHRDAVYAGALDLAEAAINHQLATISRDPADANLEPGTEAALGQGGFYAYCTNLDGTTWTDPQNLLVHGQGTRDGVTRRVRIRARGFDWEGRFAIYTMESVSVWNGSSMDIVGDVGSNGSLDFNGTPNITGSVYFNGPTAGWVGGDPGVYTVVRHPRKITFRTVQEEAMIVRPGGGLDNIAMFNDNALAIPPIVSNSVTNSVTLVGKPGGADYYLTNLNLTGNKSITFNNTNGPIRIWIGPSGGTSTANFRGGTAAIKMDQDPTKACSIYVATTSGITLAGNERLDAEIIAYNKNTWGQEYGYVRNSGNPVIYGRILAHRADINGNVTVNYQQANIRPTNYAYYGYAGGWVEVGAR
jgi:Tfp pilus assembly protein PilX